MAAGYSCTEVNQIANCAFVTHDTGVRLGDRLSADYLAERSPEGLQAQWIPSDPTLWAVERERHPGFSGVHDTAADLIANDTLFGGLSARPSASPMAGWSARSPASASGT